MKKFRVGIIGCGGIANGKHMPTLAKMPDVEMVAFCDLIPERAEKAAKEYGAPGAKVYTDYHELLADPTIDNVRVLTQNRCHCQITVDALDAGKDVLVEKPMSVTGEEAQRMIDAKNRSGRVLAVGYQHKFDSDVMYVKADMEKEAYGEVYHAKCRVLRRRGVPTWGVFTSAYENGAGPLFDIATHSLDALLYMMDNYRPRMVVGVTYDKLKDHPDGTNPFGNWDPKTFTVEDSAFGFIVMENGASIILECSWLLNTMEETGVKYLLCGTKAGADNFSGKLRINTTNNRRLVETYPDLSAGGVAFFEGQTQNNVDLEQRNFFDAIEGKAALVNTPERGKVVTDILEAIKKSSESGKPVYFG